MSILGMSPSIVFKIRLHCRHEQANIMVRSHGLSP